MKIQTIRFLLLLLMHYIVVNIGVHIVQVVQVIFKMN
nr:MAG TPA: hypothetical protein [Caudoviricetes sp.]